MQNHLDQALQRIASRTGQSLETIHKAYNGILIPNLQQNDTYLQPGSIFYQNAQRLQNLLLNQSVIAQAEDLNGLGTNRFLPSNN